MSIQDAVVEPPETEGRVEPSTGAVVSRSADGAPEAIELLNDSYARELLTTLASGPRRGRELAEACGFSRPTVYRRLNRLEAAGLVGTEIRIAPDGNHCKEFSLVRDELRLTFQDGEIVVISQASTDK
ncbi:MAG: ArsR/SmtB family transcription factor [Halohasta sp.]